MLIVCNRIFSTKNVNCNNKNKVFVIAYKVHYKAFIMHIKKKSIEALFLGITNPFKRRKWCLQV